MAATVDAEPRPPTPDPAVPATQTAAPEASVATGAAAADRAASLDQHASCVIWLGRGILLRGPSGAGKSSLALRLIEGGGVLVADDRVRLRRRAARITAEPVGLPGQIELRGQGIFHLAWALRTPVDLVVDLVPVAGQERLPDPFAVELLGLAVPAVALDPTAPTAPARLTTALFAELAATTFAAPARPAEAARSTLAASATAGRNGGSRPRHGTGRSGPS